MRLEEILKAVGMAVGSSANTRFFEMKFEPLPDGITVDVVCAPGSGLTFEVTLERDAPEDARECYSSMAKIAQDLMMGDLR